MRTAIAFMVLGCTGLAAQMSDQTPIGLEEKQALDALQEFGFWYNREAEKDYPPGTMLTYRPGLKKHPPVLTAKELAPLGRLPRVRLLSLSRAPIADDVLQLVPGMLDLRCLSLSATPISDAGLKRLGALKRLKVLGLNETGIGEAGLAELVRGTPELEELDLVGARVGDDALKEIARLKELRRLILDGAPVTDRGVAYLATGAPALSVLRLNRTEITDASFRSLANLPALTSLSLMSCRQITGVGLKEFPGKTKLWRLGLENMRVGDAALPALRKLSDIWNLSLERTEITDKGFMELAKPGGLTGLGVLNLRYTAITDAGFSVLMNEESLPTLQTIHVERTRVSRQAQVKLKGLRPSLNVLPLDYQPPRGRKVRGVPVP